MSIEQAFPLSSPDCDEVDALLDAIFPARASTLEEIDALLSSILG